MLVEVAFFESDILLGFELSAKLLEQGQAGLFRWHRASALRKVTYLAEGFEPGGLSNSTLTEHQGVRTIAIDIVVKWKKAGASELDKKVARRFNFNGLICTIHIWLAKHIKLFQSRRQAKMGIK